MKLQKLQHLKIDSRFITPFVLLPGDPCRVDIIGRRLEGFKILGQNREFRLGRGVYRSIAVTVCSTGIGCPSAAIALEELIAAGAKILIRVGTCGGSWRREIKAGSLVIPSACVRDEGTSKEYIPEGFPAVANQQVLCALANAAEKSGSSYFVGINRTHDAFYGSNKTAARWGEYLKFNKSSDSDTPILSSDMETSSIFIIASLRGARAGAVLAVNADPVPLEDRVRGKKYSNRAERSEKFTRQVVDRAINVALEALALINQKNDKVNLF